MDRKKELKAQYLQMKKDMGTFVILCEGEKKCHVEATNDLKGTMNGTKFKLECNSHPNRELQKAWKTLGAEAFTIEILELLPHKEDESQQDYSEELSIQAFIWREKYDVMGYGIYKR